MTGPNFSLAEEAPARSYLFVPADRPDKFAKALASGADAVILDLEDGVAPERKSSAREHLAHWLSADHPVYMRVNDPRTEWFRDDLALCRNAGILGIVLPKSQEIEELAALDEACRDKPILPLIESAQGFANVAALARHRGVQRLIFGPLDLQLDLGIQDEEAELLYFRSHLVLASRLAGLQPPVDGVTTDIHNTAAVLAQAKAARRLGFGGKLCIHPNQVDAANAAFSPTKDEIVWAERVMEAWQRAAGGVALLDGKMVDQPIARRAESILMTVRLMNSKLPRHS